jgi:hypothetical protein
MNVLKFTNYVEQFAPLSFGGWFYGAKFRGENIESKVLGRLLKL